MYSALTRNILVVCSAIGRSQSGAIPNRTRFECEELISRGHEVIAMGCYFEDRPQAITSYPVIEVKPLVLPRPFATISLWTNYERLVLERLENLVAQRAIGGVIETEQLLGRRFYQFCDRTGIPVISFIHCDRIGITYQNLSEFNWIMTRKLVANMKTAMRKSSGFVVLNSRFANRLRRWIQPSLQRIFVSKGVCDPELLERPLPPTNLDSNTILFAGRLSPEKGPLFLMDAFAAMKNEEAHLIIAGDGPLFKIIERRIFELNLKKKVRLLGAVDREEIFRLMEQEVAMTVVPSFSDQFASVVVEAMSRGCPVIAADTDGPHEILAGDQFGISVPPGDLNALSNAMQRLLGDKKARERYSNLGPGRAALYRSDTVVPRVCDFYEEMFSL